MYITKLLCKFYKELSKDFECRLIVVEYFMVIYTTIFIRVRLKFDLKLQFF